ncbi:HsdM family class I SAM-dependent methyltransferase [Oceanobacillus jordanicus]|uniref:site-specific DNA-methyltransferase (adenine-specific) n=1 Tax=Oceanobacillus jordanicus TaxID=2867266 RepID=A0AAW5AV13_9BACI|nr:class I SAM-dependent DNA methyltransferase [Oceanobacillus jordanicus]MCG3417550.1 type I restriction-modification system subunit M [Oceanobacillus jordanicus]
MAVKKSELYSLLWEACNKLRGGVEPSRYKDYVLVLLFFKYVSDRYKGQRFAEFTVSEGASFDDLIAAKGKSDVGERVDKIIQKFLEENRLQGSLPDVSFNNPDELGSGKELVDKVSGLIAIFQNPAIDFKNNRASGDDIIGDAYEYFMMKFAQESGKSKGQFYTPSEVSRIIARLIGIGDIKQEMGKKWTLHDPAAGSGSLLIRAADEAPTDENGDSIVTIFGQEKYPDTAGLAKMNFILHNKGTGEIKSGNTLANPAYTDDFGGLKKFDFIVMNPPFSDKDWIDGIKPSEDKYKRFDGYGIPPEKSGDYAWFLHVLKALESNGKAGIILPHGVLFRGNAEATIRKAVLDKRYIKGIVGLPANLFYGTGIPASIIIIDKENADKREGIFMIDASHGFMKDGNKNRLREQDIEKIVQTFVNKEEIEGYSHFITYKEILKENDGNLNVPRYIQKSDDTLPQNITSHLKGGIPEADIDSIERLWKVSPQLKQKIFKCNDGKDSIYTLAISPNEIETVISEDEKIKSEKENECGELFSAWRNEIKDMMLNINADINPKELIRNIGLQILHRFESAQLLDNYDVYDFLLNYWNESMQDDVYIIKASGYEAGGEVEYVYAQKKQKDESGETVSVDDTTKMKSFEGALISREVIENEYFEKELLALKDLIEKSALLESELDEMREEESGEDGLLVNALNEKGDSIPKANLNKQIKELESRKTSSVMSDITKLIELLDVGDTDEMEKTVKANSELKGYELRNKNGSFGKSKLKAALKDAIHNAVMPEVYADEYKALLAFQAKMTEKEEVDKAVKETQKAFEELVLEKYGELSVDEIKYLLFDKKWMAKLEDDITDAIDQVLNDLASRVVLIAKRYEHTLSELEEKVVQSKVRVKSALERMGYSW